MKTRKRKWYNLTINTGRAEFPIIQVKNYRCSSVPSIWEEMRRYRRLSADLGDTFCVDAIVARQLDLHDTKAVCLDGEGLEEEEDEVEHTHYFSMRDLLRDELRTRFD